MHVLSSTGSADGHDILSENEVDAAPLFLAICLISQAKIGL
jgi:hypothetical protein